MMVVVGRRRGWTRERIDAATTRASVRADPPPSTRLSPTPTHARDAHTKRQTSANAIIGPTSPPGPVAVASGSAGAAARGGGTGWAAAPSVAPAPDCSSSWTRAVSAAEGQRAVRLAGVTLVVLTRGGWSPWFSKYGRFDLRVSHIDTIVVEKNRRIKTNRRIKSSNRTIKSSKSREPSAVENNSLLEFDGSIVRFDAFFRRFAFYDDFCRRRLFRRGSF